VQSKTTGKGDDVSDHLDAGFELSQLVSLKQTEITRRYIPVNWHEAFEHQPEDITWLKEDFIEAGTLTSLFSKPGIGKSLIALELAVEVVKSGRTVMYIDDENRVSDTVDRLRAYRCTPDELDRLVMYSFAGLPALDSDEGGAHLDALAAENEPALVIMDTVSRMVSGEENASNTFLQLYRCSLVPLKARGVTVLRLDHSGKDDARGMRGSSAKESDVDVVWRLARDGENTFSLECQKSRNNHISFGQIIALERKYEPLRHIWDVKVEIPLSHYQDVITQLDRLGIPASYGRERTRSILKQNNITGLRNDQLQAAIIERRNRLRREVVPVRPEPGNQDHDWSPSGKWSAGNVDSDGCPF
jgi:AAA domain